MTSVLSSVICWPHIESIDVLYHVKWPLDLVFTEGDGIQVSSRFYLAYLLGGRVDP